MKINMGYIAKREFDRVAAFIFFEGLKIKVRMLMPYPKRIESFLEMVYFNARLHSLPQWSNCLLPAQIEVRGRPDHLSEINGSPTSRRHGPS